MTAAPHWQLKTPLSAIVFDCDGTLSAIEGVNELAKNNGVYAVVEALTTEAMNVSGLNPELYQQRLDLICPKEEQIQALAQDYFTHRVPDVHAVIQLLQRLNKTVYLVSAGVNPAVNLFGDRLGVPREQIFAVDLTFDEAGNYMDFDRQSPLIHNHGKREIVTQLKEKHATILHIGDGLNDYVTHDIVTRYVGYGGVYYRDHLALLCDYYIRSVSLAALLPLSLTQSEVDVLAEEEMDLYHKGISAIQDLEVKTGG